MKILHIVRTEPDETVKDLIQVSTNGDQASMTELYKFQKEMDWSRLVDDIFSHDKIICWW